MVLVRSLLKVFALNINERKSENKDQEFVSKAHAFCLDFHAYQTINAATTISTIPIGITEAK